MQNYEDQIQRLYVQFLGRPAIAGDLAYWQQRIDKDGSAAVLPELQRGLGDSQEFGARFALLTEEQGVDLVFQTLFGRTADPAGLQYWADGLKTHVFTLAQIIPVIASGAQGSDAIALSNKVAAAQAFTGAVDAGGPRVAHIGSVFVAGVDTSASLAGALDRLPQIQAQVANLGPNQAPTGELGIEGDAIPGTTLHAVQVQEFADPDGMGAVTYQWTVGGKPVPGANGAAFTLTDAHAGRLVSVEARYIDALGTQETVQGWGKGASLSDAQLATQRVFVECLGRPCSQEDFAHWAPKLASDPQQAALLRDVLAGTAEFAALYGGLPPGEIVDQVFQNVTGQAPDADARAYWAAQLDSDSMSIAQVITAVADGLGQGGDSPLTWRTYAASDITVFLDSDSGQAAYDSAAAHAIARAAIANVTDEASFTAASFQVGEVGGAILSQPVNHDEQVQRIFLAYLGRPVSVPSREWWSMQIAKTGDAAVAALQHGIATSSEFAGRFAGLSEAQSVSLVVQTLYGRDIDQAGLTYWSTLLEKQVISLEQVIAAIAGGAQGLDAEVLANKVTAAEEFVAAVPDFDNPRAAHIAAAFVAAVGSDASLAAALARLPEVQAQVANLPPNAAPTGQIGIDGKGILGETLHAVQAVPLADEDGMGPVTWQWMVGGVAVDGATGSTFQLTDAQAGRLVSVEARYIDGMGTPESVSSFRMGIMLNEAQLLTEQVYVQVLGRPCTEADLAYWAPRIAHDPEQAKALRGLLTATGEFAAAYDGMTSEQVVEKVFHDVAGRQVDVQARDYWTAQLDSGASSIGEMLAVVADVSDNPALFWRANAAADLTVFFDSPAGQAAFNGTSAYAIAAAHVAAVTDQASFEEASHHVGEVGAAIEQLPPNHLPSGKLAIEGALVEGQTLTVASTLADTDGMGAVTWQWLVDGMPVKGATGPMLLLTHDMVGRQVGVVASYTDGLQNIDSVVAHAGGAVRMTPAAQAVEKAYVEYLGRPADPRELAEWTALLEDGGGAPDGLRAALSAKDNVEFSSRFAGMDTAHQVDKIYHDLFGDPADPAGLAYWVPLLESGNVTLAQVIRAVSDSTTGKSAAAIDFKVQAAEQLTTALDKLSEESAYMTGAGHWVGAQYLAGVVDAPTFEAARDGRDAAVDLMLANAMPTGWLEIAGKPIVGQTLTLSGTLADPDGIAGAVAYQWYASGVPIAGANGASLLVSQAFAGQPISMQARYVDGKGYHETMLTNPTMRVQMAEGGREVQALFVEYLGRPAEPAELARWSPVLAGSAGGWEVLRDALAASPAFQAEFAGLDAHQVVDKVFMTLFGRAPDAAGATFFANALEKHIMTPASLIGVVAGGAQGLDFQTLQYKVEAAEAFSGIFTDPAREPAYTGNDAHAAAKAWLAGMIGAASIDPIPDLSGIVAVIGALPPDHLPTGSLTISGDAVLGATLQAHAALSDADGMPPLDYQWRSDGADIAGATTDTLLIDDKLAGHDISLVVRYVDGRGFATTVLSEPVVSGNDRLVGTPKADTLAGGKGNDTYVVNHTGDVAVEKPGEGVDRIEVAFPAAGSYTLPANVENATVTARDSIAVGLTGNALDNTLIGNGAANTLTGGDGNDILDGGSGKDVLAGGEGNDVYVVDNAGDVVTEGAGASADRVETTLAGYTLQANVEDLAYKGATAFTGTGNAAANDIAGGAGDDKLSGLGGADVLRGGAGNDVLAGGDGDDVLDAGTGVDVADGGAGTDTLQVHGAFADYARTQPNPTDTVLVNTYTGEKVTLRGIEKVVFTDGAKTIGQVLENVGTTGSDIVAGSNGDDVLDGGAGADTLSGGKGDDKYLVDNPGDKVTELAGEGTDRVAVGFASAGAWVLPDNVEHATVTASDKVAVNLTGNALDNILTGNGANNVLVGGDGNDTLDGGAGKDTLAGGSGNDSYVVDNTGDVVSEAADGGLDTVTIVGAGVASYTLGANVETLVVTGSAKVFSATGNALDNTIRGGEGNDKVAGMAGNDQLAGGNGNDALDGGAGNDVLAGDAGNDTLSGGDGDDTLDPGTGVDVADGGAGVDTVILQGAFADYARSRPVLGDTVLVNKATGESVTLRNVEHVVFKGAKLTMDQVNDNIASPGNDQLYGTDGADTLYGGLGADTLAGGAGDDQYTINDPLDLVVEGADGGIDAVSVAFTAAGAWTLAPNVENATVTASDKTAVGLTGNALDNVLVGNGAVNTLEGGGGNDVLDGGLGKDTMAGGAGDDTYMVDNAGDSVAEGADQGVDAVRTVLASYTLGANVENLYMDGGKASTGTGNGLDNRIEGGAAADKLSGLAGNDRLYGKDGNDTLLGGHGDDWLDAGTGADVADGGVGNDTLQVQGRFADYVRTRPTVTDTVLVNAATRESITLRGVEYVKFADGMQTIAAVNDNLATPGDDVLSGTAGNDLLDGGLGSDTLSGGAGDDTYVVNVAGDQVLEAAGGGRDLVRVAFTAAGTWQLGDHVEDAAVDSGKAFAKVAVNLTGNALDNVLTGNAAANTLMGGDGADTLAGNGGKDRLVGGAGDDLYIVTDAGAAVVEDEGGGGADKVSTTLARYTLGANVEALAFSGTGAFAGTGNALDNVIESGVGNDTLSGMGGNDRLYGKAGNDKLLGGDGDDWLDAGTGADVADGGAGDDTLHVLGNFADYARSGPNAADTRLVNIATGEDITVRNVEHVAFADGVWDTADVRLNMATPGEDVLSGTSGGDLLDGGTGADTLIGGKGDDTYVVNVAADNVVELAAEGIDLVQVAFTAGGTYLLADNVENAVVTAAATLAVNVTGNDLDNVLTGSGGANVLAGGAGSDRLTGGAGKDVFVLDDAVSADLFLDFKSGLDQIRVLQGAFHIGNGNTTIDAGTLRTAPGGFATKAELVIFSQHIQGAITADSAAGVIGSATGAYIDGARALFVVNNGTASKVYQFTADGSDALVTGAELAEVATLVGTPATVLKDFVFMA